MSDLLRCNAGKKNFEPWDNPDPQVSLVVGLIFHIMEFLEISSCFNFYPVSQQRVVIGLCHSLIVVWVICDLPL